MSYQKLKLYKGPLDPKKMGKEERKAYQIWGAQRVRNEVSYSSREFVSWWLHNVKLKKWVDPTCGRINHALGYSFDNIEMQERVDNIKERNSRLGNPGKTARAVVAHYEDDSILFPTKESAASYFNVSPKTVYNHCNHITKCFGRFGPVTKARKVVFQWV